MVQHAELGRRQGGDEGISEPRSLSACSGAAVDRSHLSRDVVARMMGYVRGEMMGDDRFPRKRSHSRGGSKGSSLAISVHGMFGCRSRGISRRAVSGERSGDYPST